MQHTRLWGIIAITTALVVPTTVQAGPGGHEVPDLSPLPANDLIIGENDQPIRLLDQAVARVQHDPPVRRDRALRFALTIRNLGQHSLDLLAEPLTTDPSTQGPAVQITQCFAFIDPPLTGGARLCGARTPIRRTVQHPWHMHMHLPGFIRYELRNERNGRPGPVVRVSHKNSICVADRQPRSEHPDNLAWYQTCNPNDLPDATRMGISPNWADHRNSWDPEQYLPLKGLADGYYWLVITINAPQANGKRWLLETNYRNNTSYRRLKLQGLHVHAL